MSETSSERGLPADAISVWRTVRSSINFSSRATRTELVRYYVITFLIGVLLQAPTIVSGTFNTRELIEGVWNLITFVPIPALFVRRMHDQDRTGWWLVGLFIVMAAGLLGLLHQDYLVFGTNRPLSVGRVALVFLVLANLAMLLLSGTKGENRFGADPRERGNSWTKSNDERTLHLLPHSQYRNRNLDDQ